MGRRPVKLAPETAAALPEVSADGKTYTIRLKSNIAAGKTVTVQLAPQPQRQSR